MARIEGITRLVKKDFVHQFVNPSFKLSSAVKGKATLQVIGNEVYNLEDERSFLARKKRQRVSMRNTVC